MINCTRKLTCVKPVHVHVIAHVSVNSVNMSSQLNKTQGLFDFNMYHSMMFRFADDYNMEPIELYHIFLNSGAGVGKKNFN